MENRAYASDMSRTTSRAKPKQGAHLSALRQAVGLTQAELAEAIGVTQPNIAFWEFADKPPRSDVLPALSRALGVSVEALLTPSSRAVSSIPKRGPKGRLLKAFEAAASLPKRQQQLVEQFVSTLVAQRKAW